MQRGGGESDELGKHKIGEKKYFKIFRAKEIENAKEVGMVVLANGGSGAKWA